ncbi:MAG: putative quinol monooxygenase [Rothia sp. (in: high G+C Gram-positive bacteria)]|nr:putative quinol monooxygenase [Rothia sp. (in: high G+C Gram-positive bacteria)]
MIGVFARATIKPEHRQDFEDLSRTLYQKSLNEEGVISYDFGPMAGQDSENEFAFIERWDSIESLEAHMETEHYKIADEGCQTFLAEPMQISIYEL